MPDIQHRSVDEHDGRFENPKVGFLVRKRTIAPLEELHNTVDAPSGNNRAANVKHNQDSADVWSHDASFDRSNMEDDRQQNEKPEQSRLQNEARFGQITADLSVPLVESGVHQPLNSIDDEDFADGICSKECGKYPAWMDW